MVHYGEERDPEDDGRRVKRTFSAANNDFAVDLRKLRDGALKTYSGRPAYFDGKYSGATFALPNKSKLGEKVAQKVFEAVLDNSARSFFESRSLINWCACAATVYPLETVGDGNCLLHAVSLGTIGIHDRELALRTALHRTLLGNSGLVFRQRWQRAQAEKNRVQGFDLEDAQWEAEWDILVNRAKEGGNSLEDIHILALAHILLRPIIVYAPKSLEGVEGEEVAPVEMGGVYLPLECDPQECHHEPLLVGYWNGHFVPFVTEAATAASRTQDEDEFPIMRKDGEVLEVQFRTEEDEDAWACITKYLKVSPLEVEGGVVFAASRRRVPADAETQAVAAGLIAEVQAEEEERRGRGAEKLRAAGGVDVEEGGDALGRGRWGREDGGIQVGEAPVQAGRNERRKQQECGGGGREEACGVRERGQGLGGEGGGRRWGGGEMEGVRGVRGRGAGGGGADLARMTLEELTAHTRAEWRESKGAPLEDEASSLAVGAGRRGGHGAEGVWEAAAAAVERTQDRVHAALLQPLASTLSSDPRPPPPPPDTPYYDQPLRRDHTPSHLASSPEPPTIIAGPRALSPASFLPPDPRQPRRSPLPPGQSPLGFPGAGDYRERDPPRGARPDMPPPPGQPPSLRDKQREIEREQCYRERQRAVGYGGVGAGGGVAARPAMAPNLRERQSGGEWHGGSAGGGGGYVGGYGGGGYGGAGYGGGGYGGGGYGGGGYGGGGGGGWNEGGLGSPGTNGDGRMRVMSKRAHLERDRRDREMQARQTHHGLGF